MDCSTCDGDRRYPTFVRLANCCLQYSPSLQSADNWRAGVAFGGGVEIALGRGFSLKGEYLYYNFGNWTYDMPQVNSTLIVRNRSRRRNRVHVAQRHCHHQELHRQPLDRRHQLQLRRSGQRHRGGQVTRIPTGG